MSSTLHAAAANTAPPAGGRVLRWLMRWRRRKPGGEARAGSRPVPTPSVSLREIETAQPAAASRAILWTLAALVTVLLVWALTARLDIVAAASGRLVPQSQVKLVQAAEPGIVRAILVRDGDLVTAGQVLIRKDATVAGADAATLAHELALKRLTVRAIDAALADRPLALDQSDPPLLYTQVSQQFSARRQALADAIAQEEKVAARARHDRTAAQQVRDKLAATLPSFRQQAESFARLQSEGFVGELMANDKRRELIEREQDLKAQEATLPALDAAIAQSERRITQLRSQFRSQLLGERVEAEAAVARLAQETAKAGFRSQLLEVRAPEAGTVQGLATTTPGAVVQAGAQLLTVVPQGDLLRAEAVLANDDIGFVQVGQRAKVKLAAYPFQKYGLLEGRVIRLSADAVEPTEAARATGSAYAAPQLAFKAVIELDAQNLTLPNGEALKLTPGMAATIEIHQGRRTVMEYLLSPVQRVTSEAGRER
jgi:HlyD family secretion protein